MIESVACITSGCSVSATIVSTTTTGVFTVNLTGQTHTALGAGDQNPAPGFLDLEFSVSNEAGAVNLREYRITHAVTNGTGDTVTMFRHVLGYDVDDAIDPPFGAAFTPSGDSDGLDFDEEDQTPAPASADFATITINPASQATFDTIHWDDGDLADTELTTLSYSVDVPNFNFTGGMPAAAETSSGYKFLIRHWPVPEPGSFVLAVAAALAVLCRGRRRCDRSSAPVGYD